MNDPIWTTRCLVTGSVSLRNQNFWEFCFPHYILQKNNDFADFYHKTMNFGGMISRGDPLNLLRCDVFFSVIEYLYLLSRCPTTVLPFLWYARVPLNASTMLSPLRSFLTSLCLGSFPLCSGCPLSLPSFTILLCSTAALFLHWLSPRDLAYGLRISRFSTSGHFPN